MMASSNPPQKPTVEPPEKGPSRPSLRLLGAVLSLIAVRYVLVFLVLAAVFVGVPIWVDTPLPAPLVLPVGVGLAALLSSGLASGWSGRLWQWLISAGIVWFILCVGLAPAVIDPNWAFAPVCCRNNLKQIGLALHDYHDTYGCLPPPYIADKRGRPMHSWRVLILPFLEQKDVYDQYDLDEPWNTPHNRRVTSIHVSAFHCPEDGPRESQDTSYLAVVGPETIWRPGKPVRLSDVADGTWSTLAVVEVGTSGIHWAEPRDLDAAQLALGVNSETGPGVSSLHMNRNWFGRPCAAYVLLADGSTCVLANDTRPALLQAMATASGGEPIEPDDFRR